MDPGQKRGPTEPVGIIGAGGRRAEAEQAGPVGQKQASAANGVGSPGVGGWDGEGVKRPTAYGTPVHGSGTAGSASTAVQPDGAAWGISQAGARECAPSCRRGKRREGDNRKEWHPNDM